MKKKTELKYEQDGTLKNYRGLYLEDYWWEKAAATKVVKRGEGQLFVEFYFQDDLFKMESREYLVTICTYTNY